MPIVTIRITKGNVVQVTPSKVVTNPTAFGLTVTWNVINNGTLVLLNPPITFPFPPPPGAPLPSLCRTWSQFTGPVTPGSGSNQWQATFPAQPSGVTQCYKYNVVYTTGVFDPEVENQGVPPQPGSGGGGGPKPPKPKPSKPKK